MSKQATREEIQLRSKMTKVRKQIDAADRALLDALAKRLRAVREIGLVKAQHNLPLLQRARWKELVADRVRFGKRLDLSEKFIKGILAVIHREAIRLQRLQRRKSK